MHVPIIRETVFEAKAGCTDKERKETKKKWTMRQGYNIVWGVCEYTHAHTITHAHTHNR